MGCDVTIVQGHFRIGLIIRHRGSNDLSRIKVFGLVIVIACEQLLSHTIFVHPFLSNLYTFWCLFEFISECVLWSSGGWCHGIRREAG